MIFNKINFRIHSLATKGSGDYSNGIRITPYFTEVTNGHYLVRVNTPFKSQWKKILKDLPLSDHKPIEKECEFIVHANAAKEIEKNIPNSKTHPISNHAWIVADEKEKATFFTTDLQTEKPVTFRKSDVQYPDTDAIIEERKGKAPIVIGLNPDYMMQICQQYKKADIRCVSLSLYDLHKAMKIMGTSVESQQTITTILMPMHTSDEEWNVEEKKQEKK